MLTSERKHVRQHQGGGSIQVCVGCQERSIDRACGRLCLGRGVSAIRRNNWPPSRPKPTWASPAAILRPSPASRPGETVVDLGCGGGLDVFLAAKRVGPTGKAIGIDMTPEMLDLARRNAAKADGGRPLANVAFYQATIDKLPLPDASVDCVISNCVINLAPDKQAVFCEIVRVLKPGGRLAVSDIALKKPLPPEIGNDLMAYVGCIAGAILIDEYRRQLIDAGFAQVDIVDTGSDLNAYAKVENQSGCCSPAMGSTLPFVSTRQLLLKRPLRQCQIFIGNLPTASAMQRERVCGQRSCFRRQSSLIVRDWLHERAQEDENPLPLYRQLLPKSDGGRLGSPPEKRPDRGYSAGIEAHGLNPDAVQVMAEAGVDISGQRSKRVSELQGAKFDYVVTVCGHAQENCPVFPGKAAMIHAGFDDPPRLAADAKTEDERLAPYRRVRDEIRAFVETLPNSLGQCRQP